MILLKQFLQVRHEVLHIFRKTWNITAKVSRVFFSTVIN